jgi:hypothetical protein
MTFSQPFAFWKTLEQMHNGVICTTLPHASGDNTFSFIFPDGKKRKDNWFISLIGSISASLSQPCVGLPNSGSAVSLREAEQRFLLLFLEKEETYSTNWVIFLNQLNFS